jgi:hypothetical protein
MLFVNRNSSHVWSNSDIAEQLAPPPATHRAGRRGVAPKLSANLCPGYSIDATDLPCRKLFTLYEPPDRFFGHSKDRSCFLDGNGPLNHYFGRLSKRLVVYLLTASFHRLVIFVTSFCSTSDGSSAHRTTTAALVLDALGGHPRTIRSASKISR